MNAVTIAPDTTPLHFDCIEDCCWSARLERAGGPTPITYRGVMIALSEGTLRSTDDGEVSFNFDSLPSWSRENLELVEALRLDWLAKANHGTDVGDTTPLAAIPMDSRLGLAIDGCIELLGLDSPTACATFLGIKRDLFLDQWFTKRMLPFLIRQGWSNKAIVDASHRWGDPRKDSAVRAARVKVRAVLPHIPTSSEAAALAYGEQLELVA